MNFHEAGCMKKFVLFIAFLSFFIFLINYLLLPSLGLPKFFKIRSNKLLDAAIVPGINGENVWIIADGSIYYSIKNKYSKQRYCIDCKIFIYIYDISGKKQKKISIDQNSIINSSNVELLGGKVWVIIKNVNDSKILVFDPNTGEKIYNMEDFIKKYKELESGIADIIYHQDEKLFEIKTKDAKILLFDPELDIFIKNKKNKKDKEDNEDKTIISRLALGSLSDEPERKYLFKVTGPKNEIDKKNYNSLFLERVLMDSVSLKFFYNFEGENLKKIYINGIIYHSDDECALIIHQDKLDKKANRILSCVDLDSGDERWRIEKFTKFKRMKIDENKNPFSNIFFDKNYLGVDRRGDFVIIYSQNEGVMVIDFKTGNVISEIIL